MDSGMSVILWLKIVYACCYAAADARAVVLHLNYVYKIYSDGGPAHIKMGGRSGRMCILKFHQQRMKADCVCPWLISNYVW